MTGPIEFHCAADLSGGPFSLSLNLPFSILVAGFSHVVPLAFVEQPVKLRRRGNRSIGVHLSKTRLPRADLLRGLFKSLTLRLFVCSDLFRDRKLSGNLLGSWCFHRWFGVSHAAGFALFVQIVKEGEELIVLTLSEWIELVIVAAGTTERNPEQDGRCRVNTICNVFNAVFLGDNSPFRIDHVISVETRCDPLVECWFG